MAIRARSRHNLFTHPDQIRPRIGDDQVDMKEEGELEREKSLSDSDSESEHSKEIMEDSSHESDLQCQSEDESRLRHPPIKKNQKRRRR